MFESVLLPEAWVALVTLTALEIVLGIDNIIFISILVGRLPEDSAIGRVQGLALAMITRILLLLVPRLDDAPDRALVHASWQRKSPGATSS